MRPLFLKIIPVALMTTVFFPLASLAAEIRLETSKAAVKTGEYFTVDVLMQTEELINATEGRLRFPADTLKVREIRDGNSSVNFWIEKPNEEQPGVVAFSGMTPGGFSGVNNYLFSVVFEAVSNGTVSILVDEATALINDGVGTAALLTVRGTSIAVRQGDSNPRREIFKDLVSPEPFLASIANDESLYEGNPFLAFLTQDKGSGVARYEVKEYRFAPFSLFAPWRAAASPYLLSDSNLRSHVIVRAIDNNGNVRTTEIPPQYPLMWYESALYWAILIALLMTARYLLLFSWKKE